MTESTVLEPPSSEESIMDDWTPLPGVTCDSKCYAQAFVRVQFAGGGDLLFCGHHFTTNEKALLKTALVVQDKREFINKAPSPSANV